MAHTPKAAGLAARRLAEIAGGDTGAGTRFVRDKDPSSPARTITAGPGESSRPVPVPKHPAHEGLPRPRTSEIVGSEAFGRYVAQIWNDLREEANRGMRDAEKHALRQEQAL